MSAFESRRKSQKSIKNGKDELHLYFVDELRVTSSVQYYEVILFVGDDEYTIFSGEDGGKKEEALSAFENFVSLNLWDE